jgi:hypothetical protein
MKKKIIITIIGIIVLGGFSAQTYYINRLYKNQNVMVEVINNQGVRLNQTLASTTAPWINREIMLAQQLSLETLVNKVLNEKDKAKFLQELNLEVQRLQANEKK